MKGDFSRLPMPSATATGVWLQQGRALLDADWNAQVAIARDAMTRVAADLIGEAGAPVDDAGFAITPRYALQLPAAAVAAGIFSIRLPDAAATMARTTLEIGVRVDAADGVICEWPARFVLRATSDGKGGRVASLMPAAGGAPLTAAAPLDRDRFTMVSIAIDGDTVALFVDGVAAGSATVGGPSTPPGPAASAAPADGPAGAVLFVGGAADGSEAMALDLAEVRLWSVCRSAGAIAADQGVRLDAGERGLILYRVFDPDPSRDEGSAPASTSAAGAAIRVVDAWVGPGRYYLDGVMVANPRTVAMSSLPGAPPPPDYPGGGPWLIRLDQWDGFATALERPDLRDPALGGPDTTGRSHAMWRVEAVPVAEDRAAGGDAAPAGTGDGRGTLDIRRVRPLDSVLSNSLYRVEIHSDGRSPEDAEVAGGGAPLFKWSNANGCVAFPVLSFAAGADAMVVATLGSEGFNGFALAVGDWLELVDDGNADGGVPGRWFRVQGVDRAALRLTLSGAGGVPALTPARHPVLRRWDVPVGTDGDASGPPARPIGARPQPLECGIEVTFGPGAYRRGDYWTFVTRDVGEGEVAWSDGREGARPPQGIAHRLAPLAIMRFGGGAEPEIEDRRRLFAAIAGDPSPRPPPPPAAAPSPPTPAPEPQGWEELPASDGAPVVPPGAAVICDGPWLTIADPAGRGVHRLDLARGGWSRLEDLPEPSGGGVGLLGYDLYAIGGSAGTATAVLAPDDAEWRAGPSLDRPALRVAVAAIGATLYLAGGTADGAGGGETDVIQRLTRTGAGLDEATLLTARAGAIAVAVGERLLIAGGEAGGRPVDAIEGYDPRSGSSRRLAPLPGGFVPVAGTAWRGSAVMLGSAEGGGAPVAAYDPETDTWRPLPSLDGTGIGLFAWRDELYALATATSTGGPARLLRLAGR